MGHHNLKVGLAKALFAIKLVIFFNGERRATVWP